MRFDLSQLKRIFEEVLTAREEGPEPILRIRGVRG